MKQKIIKYIEGIEKEKGITVLLVCETGSRAWGFPSPDSDFDIRIIYMHSVDWYLTLSEKKDTIEYMLEDRELDITGWDLRKSLRLLRKSNPPLLERIQSPIIYKVNTEFWEGIQKLAKQNYSRIASIHHYLSLAKKGYHEISQSNEIKLKKLFYALRASVACKWILEKEEAPPIVFTDMLNSLSIEKPILERIYDLIHLKSTKNESYMHCQEKELNEFIVESISNAENDGSKLPSSKASIEDLDYFFRKMLNVL